MQASRVDALDDSPKVPHFLLFFQIGVEALDTSSLNDKERAGLMIPVPGFYQYTARSIDFQFYKVTFVFTYSRQQVVGLLIYSKTF